MIIGISGKKQAGKDTVGKIIQYLDVRYGGNGNVPIGFNLDTIDSRVIEATGHTKWHVKKFAGKLKEIVSILTGISLEDLEKESVKNQILPEHWWYWVIIRTSKRIAYIGNEDFYKVDISCALIKPTIREILQEVGTDALRNIVHPDIWVNSLFTEYRKEKNWIITDVRFPNEAYAVVEKGGFLIRINRPGYGTSMSALANDHESEIALDAYDFDIVISNDGTITDLIGKVKEILIRQGIL